jgi:hypothetical protein
MRVLKIKLQTTLNKNNQRLIKVTEEANINPHREVKEAKEVRKPSKQSQEANCQLSKRIE